MEEFKVYIKKQNIVIHDSDFYFINSLGEVYYIDFDNNNKVVNATNDVNIIFFTGYTDTRTKRKIYDGDVYCYLKYECEYAEQRVQFIDGSYFLGEGYNVEHLLDIDFNNFEYVRNIHEEDMDKETLQILRNKKYYEFTKR